MFAFFSNRLGCLGSAAISIVGTIILVLLSGAVLRDEPCWKPKRANKKSKGFMSEKDKAPEKDKKPAHPPLKPKKPLTEGAPDDNDPNAQYEDKDES